MTPNLRTTSPVEEDRFTLFLQGPVSSVEYDRKSMLKRSLPTERTTTIDMGVHLFITLDILSYGVIIGIVYNVEGAQVPALIRGTR